MWQSLPMTDMPALASRWVALPLLGDGLDTV